MKLIITGLLILLFVNQTFSQEGSDDDCYSPINIKSFIDSTIKEKDRLFLDALTKDLNEMVGKDRDGSHPELFKKLMQKLNDYSKSLQLIDTLLSNDCYVKIINEKFKYEFANYKLGMYLLVDEIEKVQLAKFAMLPVINYKNAFFNLLRSKSQLEAAIGQFEGLNDGKIAAKKLADSMQKARNSIQIVKEDVINVKDVSDGMDSKVTNMQVGLDSTFLPYTNLNGKSMKKILDTHAGKVETASNVILNDARRNNWWRAALGGLAGGLIAGLIIGLFN
jgi:hypothetical protein